MEKSREIPVNFDFVGLCKIVDEGMEQDERDIVAFLDFVFEGTKWQG